MKNVSMMQRRLAAPIGQCLPAVCPCQCQKQPLTCGQGGCCFLNSSSTKKITFLKKTIMQKMKFCVNVHMRILPHMLKKGFGEIPQQAATGRPVAMLAIPGNAVLRGACFSLLRQAAQNTKVPSGTIFWRRTVWHYLGQCAIILLARIEQVSFEFVYYK